MVLAGGTGARAVKPRGFIVALLGAESTGKTTLARQLAAALDSPIVRCTWVAEHLREWCERAGRFPFAHEQAAIANEQTTRIEAAAMSHDVVVADTTALMVAAYSESVFGDTSLMAEAGAQQRRFDLNLLMALDLPWAGDGLLREGPRVQGRIDAILRRELPGQGAGFSVVSGMGEHRLQCALTAVRAAQRPPPQAGAPRWQPICSHCGDADCERLARRSAAA